MTTLKKTTIDWKAVGRRLRELRGFDTRQADFARQLGISQGQLAVEMKERDMRDSTRADAPLAQAPDAVYLDSTALSIAEVEEAILKIVRSRVTNGRDFS